MKERSRKLHDDDDAKLGRAPRPACSPFHLSFLLRSYAEARDGPAGHVFLRTNMIFGAGVQFCQCVGKLCIALATPSVYPSVRAIKLCFFSPFDPSTAAV